MQSILEDWTRSHGLMTSAEIHGTSGIGLDTSGSIVDTRLELRDAKMSRNYAHDTPERLRTAKTWTTEPAGVTIQPMNSCISKTQRCAATGHRKNGSLLKFAR